VYVPRRRTRGRNRILYWFRTPPGVRVGRAPLDEDAIRLIEEHHPNIRFDWQQILKGEDENEPVVAEPEPEPAAPAFDGAQGAPSTRPGAVFVDDPSSPAHAHLGSEGLARLRARHAEVLASISRRVGDPAKAEQLKTEAERLNPDAWVTADDVRSGIERYETVFESIREAMGRRRRRRRRSGGTPPGQPATAPPESPESPESEE
jgi:hypothetical protein